MEYRRNRIKILIVDDQALFATSLRLVLENCAGDDFEVVGIASNGRDCVDRIGALAPDVVLMDVYMPEMDGVEATAALLKLRPATKVMMLTTFADDTYVKKALRSGASGYVLKSIDAEDLITCIKAVYNGLVLLSSSLGSWMLGEMGSDDAGDGGPRTQAVPSEGDKRGQRQDHPRDAVGHSGSTRHGVTWSGTASGGSGAPTSSLAGHGAASSAAASHSAAPGRSGSAQDGRSTKVAAIMERFPDLKPREAEILLLLLNGCNNHQIASELLIAEQTVRNYTSSVYTKIGVDDRLQAIQLFSSLR